MAQASGAHEVDRRILETDSIWPAHSRGLGHRQEQFIVKYDSFDPLLVYDTLIRLVSVLNQDKLWQLPYRKGTGKTDTNSKDRCRKAGERFKLLELACYVNSRRYCNLEHKKELFPRQTLQFRRNFPHHNLATLWVCVYHSVSREW